MDGLVVLVLILVFVGRSEVLDVLVVLVLDDVELVFEQGLALPSLLRE